VTYFSFADEIFYMQANKMNTLNLKLFIDTFGIVVLIFNSAFIVLKKLLGSFKLSPWNAATTSQ